jgi:hypothetical protein
MVMKVESGLRGATLARRADEYRGHRWDAYFNFNVSNGGARARCCDIPGNWLRRWCLDPEKDLSLRRIPSLRPNIFLANSPGFHGPPNPLPSGGGAVVQTELLRSYHFDEQIPAAAG